MSHSIDWNHLQGVIITDEEYPVRPAFSLLTKILEEFTTKVPQSAFSNPSSISFPEITTYIQKYQDPTKADTILRVQQELDETKIVLVRFKFKPRLMASSEDDFSTKQLNLFYNAGRNWTILWNAPTLFLCRVKCFTRQRKRYVPVKEVVSILTVSLQ